MEIKRASDPARALFLEHLGLHLCADGFVFVTKSGQNKCKMCVFEKSRFGATLSSHCFLLYRTHVGLLHKNMFLFFPRPCLQSLQYSCSAPECGWARSRMWLGVLPNVVGLTPESPLGGWAFTRLVGLSPVWLGLPYLSHAYLSPIM